MPAKVHFRGPILFVHHHDTLLDVRIPDCRSGGKHADGSHAEPHGVGLLHLRGGTQLEAPVVMYQSHMEISANGGTADAKLVNEFPAKVSLNKLVSAEDADGKGIKLGKRDGEGVHTVIDIKGGSLDAGRFTDPVEIPYQLGNDIQNQRIPLLTTWQGDAPVTITGLATDVLLNDGDELFIYNWERTPKGRAELESPMNPATTSMQAENDFKWLYKLLETPSGYEQWLKDTGKSEFPAPRSTIVEMTGHGAADTSTTPPFFPPNSACDGGNWEEPPK